MNVENHRDEELVSVVIPTYSRPETLKRAVSSVVRQTHRRLEIIVVDDNAEDPGCRESVRRVLEKINDPRIRIIFNKKNLGGALSRNAGIRASNAEYIAFLDDDDEYHSQKIEKQLECFHNSGLSKLALVYCHTVSMQNSKEALRTYRYTFRGNCVFEGMRDCIAATSQWMCRKEALVHVGGFSCVPCKQDSNLIVKLLVRGYSVDYVPLILTKYYRDAGGGISTQGHLKRIEGEEALRSLCRKNYGLITEKEREEVEYSFAARLIGHYYAAHMTRQFREQRNILLRHPFRRKTWGILRMTYGNR